MTSWISCDDQLDQLAVTVVGAGHSRLLLLLLGGVGGGEDVGDVGGEQVVHLVAERGLEHQLGVGAGVPDGEVEEGRAAHPVDNVTEGERGQQVLTLVAQLVFIYVFISTSLKVLSVRAWTKVIICAAVKSKKIFCKRCFANPMFPTQPRKPPTRQSMVLNDSKSAQAAEILWSSRGTAC